MDALGAPAKNDVDCIPKFLPAAGTNAAMK
jgi:hypothetical protein